MGDGHDIYNRVAEVQREEAKRKKDVVRVPPSFFRDIREEMRRYDAMLEEGKDLHVYDRKRIFDRRARLEAFMDDILFHRTRKIFYNLLFALIRGDELETGGGYAEEERWLIERLTVLLREYIDMVRHGTPPDVVGATERGEGEGHEEEHAEAEGEEQAGAQAAADEVRGEDEVLVRILEDVGAIAMHDGTVCHLRKGDVLHLPLLYAKPLLAMGSAEEVSTPFLRGGRHGG